MQLLSINRETGNLAKHFISGAHRCINFSTCVFINEIQRKMISVEKLIVSCIKIGNAFNVHKTYFVIVSHPPKCRQRDFSQHSCIETDIVSSASKVAQKDFSPQLFAVFDFIQIILNSMNAVTWGYLFIPTRDLNFRPYNFALFESSATYECKWYSVQNKGIRFLWALARDSSFFCQNGIIGYSPSVAKKSMEIWWVQKYEKTNRTDDLLSVIFHDLICPFSGIVWNSTASNGCIYLFIIRRFRDRKVLGFLDKTAFRR